MDQILTVEVLGKTNTLNAAFMDLEKTYDRVETEVLLGVKRIFG